MIELKIEQIGDDVGFVLDDQACEFLGVGLGDDFVIEQSAEGLLVHTMNKRGGQTTFNARIGRAAHDPPA